MMKNTDRRLASALVLLALTCVPLEARAAESSANDTALFLAGMPPKAGSPLLPFMKKVDWAAHANFFDRAWARNEQAQFSKIRTWAGKELNTSRNSVAFYMFSGPDFLYADTFFPDAATYVLCGTEAIGPLPDISAMPADTLDPALANLRASLNSVLNFSFFITKEMKVELDKQELKGTLPIFYVFLARLGKEIREVQFVALDNGGNLSTSADTAASKGGRLTPGVKIVFSKSGSKSLQTLYYFTSDLSDSGIKQRPGFIRFCERLGRGSSLLKSASYLMFSEEFSTVRSFLLKQSALIVQDDSGIPISFFRPEDWKLAPYGDYIGPIPVFKQYYQPQLKALYESGNPQPLDFGVGYRWHANRAALLVAERK